MIKRLVTRYWLLLPLLILIVVLLDRAEQPEVVETEETLDMRETRSDYYLSEFRTRRFNVNGNIEYIVEGETLAHYPDDDRSEIKQPTMQLQRNNVQWVLTSETGRFDPAPNLFTLRGNVTVERTLASADIITMNTESLRIANEANLIETDELIEISAPTWTLKARGLRTAINEGQLTLLSEVVGRYELPAPTTGPASEEQ